MGISVIVITLNEEHNIVDCLESVKWADEIVIVDSCSTDRTVELAQRYSHKIFIKEGLGYATAKNFALTNVSHEWVLWLDADERVTPELALEIQSVVRSETKYSGYTVARRAYFLGRWIKHCGWYPGRVTRLFKRTAGKFNTALVHEQLLLEGEVGELKHDLIHYTDHNLEHYFNKFNRYTSFAAQDLCDKHKRFKLSDIIIRPFFMFIKMYFLKQGFLDGIQGFILSIVSSCYVFTKYAKLWERERR